MIEHYVPSQPQRAAELEAARRANVTLGMFSEIVPLASEDRLTFGKAFRVAAERWPGRICVLANADIEFDYTAMLLPPLVRPGRIVTLTRWEQPTAPRMLGRIHGERFFSGSQDAWAWLGGGLVGLGDAVPLGYVGCDQAILGECMSAGIEILNPSLDIRTRHNHAGLDREERPCVAGTYCYPELGSIHGAGSVIWHQWPQ